MLTYQGPKHKATSPPPQPPLPFRDFEIGWEVVARVFPTGRSLRGEVQEWDFFKGALR